MTTSETTTIVRQYMEAGVNQGDVSIVDTLLAPDFVFHFPGSPVPLNSQGWAQTTRLFQSAFPNQNTTVDELIGDDGLAAARFTFHGTHTGDFQGIPPTGKAVTMTGMAFWRLAGGRIAEHWVELDTIGLMQQLGAIPGPAPAA